MLMWLVQGQSLGRRANSKAPEFSSKTLQYTCGAVQITWKPLSLISLSKNMMGSTLQKDMERAMYLASVVDSANCDCNLEAQMMGHPAEKMIQLLLFFLRGRVLWS